MNLGLTITQYLWDHDRKMLAKVVGVTYVMPVVTEILPRYITVL